MHSQTQSALVSLIVFTLAFLIMLTMFTSKYDPTPIIGSDRYHDQRSRFQVEEFDRRKKRINHFCTHNQELNFAATSFYHHLIFAEDHRLACCPVFKAASTTWLSMLYKMSRQIKISGNIEHNIIQENQHKTEKIRFWNKEDFSEYVLSNNFTSVLIVRHPFERLVSSFRDKLERFHFPPVNISGEYFYNAYGKWIVKRYRTKLIEKFGEEIVGEARNHGAPIPVENNQRPSAVLPNFWEFVQYLIELQPTDEHWDPIFKYCSPCDLEYDVIIKFENLAEETLEFLHDQNLNKLLPKSNSPFEKRFNERRPKGMTSAEITKLYFEQLDTEDIAKLYVMYEEDFKLFDYHFTIGNIKLPP